MNLKNLIILSLIFMIVQTLEGEKQSSGIAVIVNKSVNKSEISLSELIEIYTLSKKLWDNDIRIVVYDMKGDSEYRDLFYTMIGFSRQELQKIWLRKQFSGASLPPKTYKEPEDIIESVIETDGSIAYVPLSYVSDKVRILTITDD